MWMDCLSVAGTIFRLKGAIVGMSFLDCNGILIQSVFDQWKDSVGSSGGSNTNLVCYGKEKDNRDVRDDKALKTPSEYIPIMKTPCVCGVHILDS